MSRLTERIENFNKAFDLYRSAIAAFNENEVLTHLALVQSFEIVVELAWKVLKDYLSEKGINALTPKDVIKESFSVEIIENAQLWIDMIDDRNASSNEYNMDRVNKIIVNIKSLYFDELTFFHNKIEEFNG